MRLRCGEEVARAELAVDQKREQQTKVRAEIEQAVGRRDDLADDPAGFQSNEATIRELDAEHARLDLVIGRRERDVEEAKRQAAHAEWGEARKAAEKANTEARTASAKIAGLVGPLLAALAELESKRALRKQAIARYCALVPSDVDDYELPSGQDEQEWTKLDDIQVELLQARAIRPEAKARVDRERWARETEQREKAAVNSVVKGVIHGAVPQLDNVFLGLTEEQRAEVLRRVEGHLDGIRSEVRGRFADDARGDLSASPVAQQEADRIAGVIGRRCERLRRLATDQASEQAVEVA